MSWTDEEIDKMFQENADGLQFEYKNAYWKEMEAMLPKGGTKGDFLWFFTSFVFLGLFGVMAVFNAQTSFQTNQTKTGNTIAVASLVQNDSKNYNVSNEKDPSNSVAKIDKENETDFTEREKLFLFGNGDRIKLLPLNTEVQQVQVDISEQGRLDFIESNKNSWNLDSYPVNHEIKDFSDESNTDYQIDRLDFLRLDLNGVDANVIETYSPRHDNIASTFGLYIQAVGGISQSLISPSKKMSNSFGLGIGTQLGKRNWTYSFGVNGIVSNHQDIVLNRSAKVYGFGSEIFNYKVDYQQLYLLEGNFQARYSFGRHGISVGVRPSYAFSSKVRMNQSQMENTMIETQVESNSRSVYGYMDGLKRFGLKPMFGYSWSVMPGMELGVNVGIQVMPQINEDFINGINNKLPIDGQVYFRKTLDFRK